MNKKKILISLTLFIFMFCFTSCSLSRRDLIKENQELYNKNQELIKQIEDYKNLSKIYDFYNDITTENINSFVLVESKNIQETKVLYSNGVVIASNGLDYYVLTDYNAIIQNGIVSYRVMDAKATVYKASIAEVSDAFSGLVILRVSVSSYTNVTMTSLSFGEKSDLAAYVSSMSQINKVQLTNKIKTSTVEYNNTSFESYYLDNTNFDSGTLLLNSDNELCGIYSSKLGVFVSQNLIKEIMFSIYSLVL